MENKLKQGDVVSLLSNDDIKMTIVSISETDIAEVIYSDGKKLVRDKLPLHVIRATTALPLQPQVVLYTPDNGRKIE